MDWLTQLPHLFSTLVDIFLHLDVHLSQMAVFLGPWLYLVLFLVIFCETGLVVTPFLPGDSLLFATGALAALPESGLHVVLLWMMLIAAGVLGDASNYMIGRKIGPKIFSRSNSRWLKREYLDRTHGFYEKYGGKTIFFAHFIPIIRTFAPFVAGIGKMSYRRFGLFNVTGVSTWVTLFVFAGYRFGQVPTIKSNFHFVVVAIIGISVTPAVIEAIRAKRVKAKHAAEGSSLDRTVTSL